MTVRWWFGNIRWLLVLLGLSVLVVGCAPAVAPPTPTPTPSPIRPLVPTFTPTATPTATPLQAMATPVPATVPPPQATAPAPPSPTPMPTPTVPVTPSPTPTPTPYVEVARPRVNVRSGPGVVYPLVGQLAQGAQVPIIAQDPAGQWWQVCCVNGQEAWIASWVVETFNDTSGVPVAQNIPTPPPTPTPRPTPTPAPTPTPPFLFERVFGPHPILNTNPIMTVWVLVAAPDGETPVGGVQVRLYYGGSIIAESPATTLIGYTRPSPDYGFYFPYNAKLEVFNPPSGEFQIVVVQGGQEVSPRVPFNRGAEAPGAEFYFKFQRK